MSPLKVASPVFAVNIDLALQLNHGSQIIKKKEKKEILVRTCVFMALIVFSLLCLSTSHHYFPLKATVNLSISISSEL